MGTSSSNRGPQGPSPLVPSWADETATPKIPEDNKATTGSKAPPNAPAKRFQSPRNNFTRFVRSSGTEERALRRAVTGYVAGATGGAANAARRMGTSRMGAQALYSLLQAPPTGAAAVLD